MIYNKNVTSLITTRCLQLVPNLLTTWPWDKQCKQNLLTQTACSDLLQDAVRFLRVYTDA